MTKARTLADFIADGSPLADGTISVSEVSGAAPLASPSFTGDIAVTGTVDGRDVAADGTKLDTVETNADVTDATNVQAAGALMDSELSNVAAVKALDQGVSTTDDPTFTNAQLAAISSTIADTAVDIFVYDTRKDSDGGAWRKRTQHTSWYNETLNTATRGSRKEFPAVAVIVAETSKVTIYDGDDPDLPMWMVFTWASEANVLGYGGRAKSCLTAKDGKVVTGSSQGNDGVYWADFIADHGRRITIYGLYETAQSIYPRINTNHTIYDSTKLLVNGTVNDVAMTVLPNAPIDAATGLPVPTIAVGCADRGSIIKDDGTVVTISINTGEGISKVEFFDSSNMVLVTTAWGHIKYIDAKSGSYLGLVSSPSTSIPRFLHTASTPNQLTILDNSNYASASGKGMTVIQEGDVRTLGSQDVLGSAVYITSDYSTGWMNGDIKLATLSDTDDTDVTGSELVTNGTFDTDTSGWTAFFGTISVTGGVLQLTSTSNYNYAQQTISGLTVGKTYVLSADVVSGNSNTLVIIRNGGSTVAQASGTGTKVLTFEAPATSLNIWLYQIYANTSTFDNVSLRLAEEDRSVNGNGLQVFGTVTKNPVATGADLVAYSGFSASNYLQQPYNSDLVFAASDPFCIMCWYKTSSTSNYQALIDFGETVTGKLRQLSIYTTTGELYFAIQGSNTSGSSSVNVADGSWNFATVVSNGTGTIQIYNNGSLYATDTLSLVDMTSAEELRIGNALAGGFPFLGSLALTRISATAPSAEQIAKIYEDEKVLFQAGAQATLYGSSDAVTALAYDDSTELLHVGTSAGRSVFQGLRRVDNTTTAVGAAISASNGLVADE